MRAVLSRDAVTMRDPSGLKAAEYTKSSWPRRIAISLALAASQMRAVLSRDAVTMRDPSGLKAAEFRTASWPRRTAICLAVAASQMRAVLSHDAVTMRDPSGLKAAEFTASSWPPRTKRQSACEEAAASAAAAGEALVLSAGNARSMRVPRAANLSALSKSLRDSLVVETSARMLACAWSSSICRLLSDSFNAALLACSAETLARASSSRRPASASASSFCHQLSSAFCKPFLLHCQLLRLVPLQIPYGCTCDEYDRSNHCERPTCDPLQARGASLGCLYLSDLRLLALKLRPFIPKPLRFGLLAGADQ